MFSPRGQAFSAHELDIIRKAADELKLKTSQEGQTPKEAGDAVAAPVVEQPYTDNYQEQMNQVGYTSV